MFSDLVTDFVRYGGPPRRIVEDAVRVMPCTAGTVALYPRQSIRSVIAGLAGE